MTALLSYGYVILLFLISVYILFSDVKYYKVSLWSLILAFLLFFLRFFYFKLISGQDVLINLVISAIYGLVIFLFYFLNRHKYATVWAIFGPADVIAFLCLAVGFKTLEFMVLLMVSMLLGIVFAYFKKWFSKSESPLVPLAGIMVFCGGLWGVVSFVMGFL
jgi:hypothetical protein